MRFSDKSTLSTNSRIETLLKRLGVSDRLVQQNADVDKMLATEIDTEKIQKQLDGFREESLQYLVGALNN